MARISKAMLKSKAIVPPDPQQEEDAEAQQESASYERMEHREMQRQMQKQNKPSIAAMIKVSGSKKRSK